ncbi:MAG: sel1 repeat family protein [Polyangiaceae bacterium]|nr:sel1 repeat family protein [Polyangiaceae bacterium]
MLRSAVFACVSTFALVACASSSSPGEGAAVADVTVSSSAVAASSVTELSSSSPLPRDSLFLKCEGHDREACVKLASHCYVGVKADPQWESKECAERERRACDEGVGEYCSNLADRYSRVTGDVGVPKDEVTALRLYDKACDLGNAGYNACTIAAYAYEAGNLGLPKDSARAVAIFESLCDEEGGVFPQSCQSLARHLASGDGVA